ncbi:MAG TPA: DUF3987 domain-containing protein, partial [Vicinamibacterales bacterium]
LQLVFDDKKLYIGGGQTQGAFHPIAGTDKRRVLVCEGYATGYALVQATGHPVACAMSAHGVEPVVAKMKRKYPDREIVVMGDNDHGTARDKPAVGNPGLLAAEKANQVHGVRYFIPEFEPDDAGTDWDDWLRAGGDPALILKLLDDNGPRPLEQPALSHVEHERLPETSPARPLPANDAPAEREPYNFLGKFTPPTIREEWLPGPLANYVFRQAVDTHVDPSIMALSVIVACAAALHDGIKIQPKRRDPTWTESARLWGAVVGDPSIRKTPAISKATSHLRKLDMEMARASDAAGAEYEQAMKVHKKREDNATKRAANGEPTGDLHPAPEQPRKLRLIAEDSTVEAMSTILKDNERGILVIQDELSAWFGAMDAYKQGAGKDRGLWLQAYNGGPMRVDRVMRGAVLVPNWSACMVGGIQPEAMRAISEKLPADGLLQRFMVVVGQPRDGIPQDVEYDRHAVEDYRLLLDKLFSLAPSEDRVKLSEDAHRWREKMMEFSHGLAATEMIPPGMRSHLGKWDGLFARLLLVFHAIEGDYMIHPAEAPVSGATAERVFWFMRRFLFNHAMAFYRGVMGQSERDSAAQWLGTWILADGLGDFALRDIMRSYKRWATLPEWQQQGALRVLEDAGWTTAVRDDEARRATRWTVNPRVHEAFGRFAADAKAKKQRDRERIDRIFGRQADDDG